jgi:hypothetical protein
MTNPLILLTTSIISGLIFIFFIVTGIIRKSVLQIISSLLFLGISAVSLFFLAVALTSKASSELKESVSSVKQKFKSRTGDEIYYALFGKPVDKCLKVINQSDQVVPRLDCCIWLEFQTCPTELNRIAAQEHFKATKYISGDTATYIPHYSPKPEWWTPQLLGDSIIVLRDFNFDNPNRDKMLMFAKDSSHAFYCDMAD